MQGRRFCLRLSYRKRQEVILFRNNEFILTCLLLSIYEDATSCYDTEELRFSARFGRVGEIINKIIKGTTLEGSLPLLFRVRKNRIRDP